MDSTHAQGILVNAAGLLYASFGFSLSVIAALFNLIYRRTKVPSEPVSPPPSYNEPAHPTHPRVRRPPIRSFSDTPSRTSPHKIHFLFEQRSSQQEKSEIILHRGLSDSPSNELIPLPTPGKDAPGSPPIIKKKCSFRHQRSQSIPAILVDNFDSSEYITWNSPDLNDLNESRPPLYKLAESLPPSPAKPTASVSTSTSSLCGIITGEKPRPRLLNPKSWGKDRKPKTLKRCMSSPQLCNAPFLLVPAQPNVNPVSSDSQVLREVSLKKTKSWKTLRKSRSSATPDKGVPKPESRKAEKKKSQTLRTHPYEAPYFAPPPIAAMPVHITFISEPTASETSSRDSSPKSSLDRKPLFRRLSKS